MNALLLGSLLYQSRLVPRILPVLGFIGAPLLVASTTATLFGANEYGSAMSGLLTLPIAIWEFSLGVYLVVKGFRAAGLQQLGFVPAPADDCSRRRSGSGRRDRRRTAGHADMRLVRGLRARP